MWDRRNPNPPAPRIKHHIPDSSVMLIPQLRDYTGAPKIPYLSPQCPANDLGADAQDLPPRGSEMIKLSRCRLATGHKVPIPANHLGCSKDDIRARGRRDGRQGLHPGKGILSLDLGFGVSFSPCAWLRNCDGPGAKGCEANPSSCCLSERE